MRQWIGLGVRGNKIPVSHLLKQEKFLRYNQIGSLYDFVAGHGLSKNWEFSIDYPRPIDNLGISPDELLKPWTTVPGAFHTPS
jgi:hypothetical protein